MAEVTKIDGEAGNYVATVKLSPRYVNENCTGCGDCAKAVERGVRDEYNYGLTKRKGAYLPHVMAHPMRYVIDPRIVGTEDGQKAKAACKYDAVELDDAEKEIRLPAGAVIWATGWKPYDAAKIQPYGYGRVPNVVTSVEFERMADPKGPTGGKLVRPVRRQGGEEGRLHPVRRLARPQPPAPLLAHLLHGEPEADDLRARMPTRTPTSASTTSTSARSTGSRISTRRSRPSRTSASSSRSPRRSSPTARTETP